MECSSTCWSFSFLVVARWMNLSKEKLLAKTKGNNKYFEIRCYTLVKMEYLNMVGGKLVLVVGTAQLETRAHMSSLH